MLRVRVSRWMMVVVIAALLGIQSHASALVRVGTRPTRKRTWPS